MAYLASKPRYEILDGLRGVAALMVVIFHLFETYSRGPEYQIINHGYLAVDFFFVLSGFVIGYAYDDRWGTKLDLKSFFKRRLTRLHPMVVMGALIGLLWFYNTDAPAFPLIGQTPWYVALGFFALACLMIPVTPSADIRGWSETYPLNGVTWSLFFEYIANILYAVLIRRFSKLWLGVFCACSALMTIDITMNINAFGLLSDAHPVYTIIGGWSLNPEQLYIGFGRLLYPFFCGLLVSRIGRYIKLRGGFWWCSLLVVLALIIPRVGGTTDGWMNGLYEAGVILILFPLIVAMGAGSRVTDKRSAAVCTFLGEISFPLYITHNPLVYLQMKWAAEHTDAPLSQHILFGAGIVLLAVATACATLKLYDEPVRAWLRKHWF